jgi:hypothetical protein
MLKKTLDSWYKTADYAFFGCKVTLDSIPGFLHNCGVLLARSSWDQYYFNM